MNDQQPLVTRTDFISLPVTSFEKAEQSYGAFSACRARGATRRSSRIGVGTH